METKINIAKILPYNKETAYFLQSINAKISKTINSNLRDFETKILREKASEFLLFLIIKEK